MYGLLGETPIVEGCAGIKKDRSVAFCDQLPFIQNATVRDNILFGKPYDEKHYRETLRVCCLEPDLLILPAGDLTELGGKGVNLSGMFNFKLFSLLYIYHVRRFSLSVKLTSHVSMAFFLNVLVHRWSKSKS